MDAREQRGLIIAATQKLTQKGKVWLVPSQSGKGKYTVCPDDEKPFCSCPDHEETGEKCKHLYAVEFTMKRDTAKDGTITETRTFTFTEKKVYRQQDWPLYNLAQAEEKRRFLVLLHDLCKGVEEPPPNWTGRRRTPMAEMIFVACFKVYTGLSGRRCGTDFDEAHEKGYISHKINPMMACMFLENELMTPALKQLIEVSAAPLRAVETAFAPDSTGFSTSRHVRWHDEKYGRERSGRDWVKTHCMAGTTTHIVTAVEIHDRDAADCPQFKPLLERTVQNGFEVKEVSADKAYLSRENLEAVDRIGGTPYIPFKVNSVPDQPGTLWEKLYHYYAMNREEFMARYHRRSNIESVFSMVKAKFRDHVRAMTTTAMRNEVLCKLLCHNICCLLMSQFELGIEPMFWGPSLTAPAQPSGKADVVRDAAPVETAKPASTVAETGDQWRCLGW
jgi:transposase